MKKDIRAYGYDRLKEGMEALGEKPFRAKQVYEWLHVKLADDFDEMTNLSKALREKLLSDTVQRKLRVLFQKPVYILLIFHGVDGTGTI